MAAIYVPFMQNLFGVIGLSTNQLLICAGIAFTVIPSVEVVKKLTAK